MPLLRSQDVMSFRNDNLNSKVTERLALSVFALLHIPEVESSLVRLVKSYDQLELLSCRIELEVIRSQCIRLPAGGVGTNTGLACFRSPATGTKARAATSANSNKTRSTLSLKPSTTSHHPYGWEL